MQSFKIWHVYFANLITDFGTILNNMEMQSYQFVVIDFLKTEGTSLYDGQSEVALFILEHGWTLRLSGHGTT